MYLKSIDMQGFKSFAGKTKLEFHDGITGIVGPNGSGKSNVADAVRWVLGEQSAKQLRGGNMQDVIFAGTQNRKPLGYASVAITLDNADRQLKYDSEEVTVTRRLYRSGESEYLLNGRNCRLRDIQELFYDTGIGKEGYSIIGQGQIDKILSGKPEDRRELFDEAAGIVKFKRRKMTSLKKLEQEESNLVRVTDILTEVKRQIGPLEKQAEKAEAYLLKRDDLRRMDIQLFLQESERTEAQQKELAEKKGIASEQLADTAGRLEKTRQEYDDVERKLEELDAQIGRNREDLQKAALLKQESEGQIRLLDEQIRATQSSQEQYRERLTHIGEEVERRKEEAVKQEEEKSALQNKLQEALQQKEEKEAALLALQEEMRRHAQDTEKGRAQTIALLNDRSEIKERIQRYDTMREQIEIRKAELSARMLERKRDTAQEEEKEKELAAELARITAAVLEKRNQIDERDMQIEALRINLETAHQQLDTCQTSYHRDSSRLESLRNIAERYEGYGNSVKKIMEQKKNNPGIHGVLADLIKTQKKYETAIETALGGHLQNIVTDNESTAKYLIEYLKRGHFGRATFLPLTSVKNTDPFRKEEVLKEQGAIGRADTLLVYDKRYEGIVGQLLGKTVVVDTIDHAIAIGRKYGQSVRMVTLEGDLLSPGGSMTGGAFKYNSNLLGRKRQIQELEESTRTLKKELEELQHAIETDRESRNKLREEAAALSDELQNLILEENTAQLNLETGKEHAEALRTEYRRLTEERTDIENQVSEITETTSLIREELSLSEEKEKELEEKAASLQEAEAVLHEREQEALAEQDQARLAFSAVQQQCAFADEKLKTAREELQRSEEEQKTLEAGLLEEGSGIQEKEIQIESIRKNIAVLEEGIQEGEQSAAAWQEQKDELTRSHREFFSQRDQLAEQRSRLEQELFRLQAQEEKLTESQDQMVNYLYEEYQMTPDQAAEYTFGTMPSRAQLRKDIRERKAEIRALGDVNVNAVSEYKELKERHDFLSAQHEDLVTAADTLHGIIKELDDGMRRQFREKFGLIREEFDRVFQELFGGGKGTLELVEGEDILESGIQIISQPPGKKLQNMMQLSGGEKALTAIALLFAIQDLKPSPFCLLDEIEAALDDHNVGRFSQYLHKLTKNTQFIIITHRRGTMTAADRLYGITMQEKGISTMVSVDLIEAQLDK
ncbi:MAG: chromosome segregation protein SMC [Eubacterium sp.]|nr:chromosome segregation protein SMC [Eubacterium sp.]